MWVGGQVTNKILDGFNSDKTAIIISDENDVIAARVMAELGRGVTFLSGEGAYSKDHKKVIACVVNHYQIPKIKEIALEIDPKAFMFILETVEVHGKGFTLPFKVPNKNLLPQKRSKETSYLLISDTEMLAEAVADGVK